MIKLHLPLTISKNALHIPVRCGKWTKLVRSKAARMRGEMIVVEIWKQMGGRLHHPAITTPCSLTWTITFPDHRKRDGQNFLEHLADCLQAANVVSDDNLIVHEVMEVMPIPKRPGWIDLEIVALPQGVTP